MVGKVYGRDALSVSTLVLVFDLRAKTLMTCVRAAVPLDSPRTRRDRSTRVRAAFLMIGFLLLIAASIAVRPGGARACAGDI